MEGFFYLGQKENESFCGGRDKNFILKKGEG